VLIFEQKKGTSLVKLVLSRRKFGLRTERLSVPVILGEYCARIHSEPATTSTTTNNNKDNHKTFHLSFIFKLISLYLILIKSSSPKDFKTTPKEKHHHHQQQHYHNIMANTDTNSILNNNKNISTSNRNIPTLKEC
jgi:hypothetical protein